MQIIKFALAALLSFTLAACGGGGGSSSSTSSSGGGTVTPPQNTVAVYVDSGPTKNGLNGIYTTVTICAPGANGKCQTIDHVLVDTGSSGLRLLSTVLQSGLGLGYATDAKGNILSECTQFIDGYTWGPIVTANLTVGSEVANQLPIQIIGDTSAIPQAPTECSNNGFLNPENTVASFGANGVLGVGQAVYDCGATCASGPAGVYYACSATSCVDVALPLSQQLVNPVTRFPVDNNGVIINLPSVPLSGLPSLNGTVTFGIGTQTNNGLGNASVYTLDPLGQITTRFNGSNLNASFIDSGSNGLFFPSNSIPTCASGFFCPGSTVTLNATIQGNSQSSAGTTALSGPTANITFMIGNVDALLNNNSALAVFSQLGGSTSSGGAFGGNSFDFGLPFFFGRTVYTAIEGKSTPSGTGPYVAF